LRELHFAAQLLPQPAAPPQAGDLAGIEVGR
jgi:hypothetical protein